MTISKQIMKENERKW